MSSLSAATEEAHICPRHAAQWSPANSGEPPWNSAKLGTTGSSGVSALGLGCMGMSDVYGPADRGESIATVHAALDAGITLLDTGDFYAMGHNEMLIREALAGRNRDRFQISVKFGALRGPAMSFAGMDCRPAAVEEFPRLFAAAAGRRLHRHLSPGAARSQRSRSRKRSAPSPTW